MIFLRIIILIINAAHFGQCEICKKFTDFGAKCSSSAFSQFSGDISYDLSLNGVENLPANAFKNIALSSLFIKDSSLTSVSGDAFKGIRQINYFELHNVNNIELLLSGNNSHFLFDNVLSLTINKNSNINSTNFDFFLSLINNLNVKILTMLHLNIQNLTLNFSTFNFEDFYLASNKIGSIKVVPNGKIKRLYLDRNDIESITFDSNRSKLLYLNLNNNEIEQFKCPNLSTLTDLILSTNKLSVITNETFYKLINVENINLRQNRINYIEGNSFKKLHKLKELYLNLNFISEANPQLVFKSVYFIDISQNRFNSFDFEQFFSFRNTSLKRLVLSGNFIRNIFVNLTEIDYLDLSGNPLIKVDDIYAKKINNLYLNKNLFENLNSIHLKNVALISNLKLISNKLENLPVSELENLQNLVSLDLEQNKIEKIEFPTLALLKELRLNHNKIRKISQISFNKLANLQVLILSFNKIDFIEEKSFSNLKNLQVLNLNHNYLVQLPDFSYFISIQEATFNFQNGQLKTLNSFNFPNLVYEKNIKLEFYSNQLASVSPHLFCSKNVEILKNGQIYMEDVNVFDKCLLTQIKGLNLTIKSRKKSKCELKKFAKLNNITIDDDQDLNCANFTQKRHCSNFFDLKYDCSYDVKSMNRSTIWMIDSYFRSFKCNSINTYSLTPNFSACLRNKYFQMSCIANQNKQSIVFDPADFEDFNKNYKIFSLGEKATGIFHILTRTLIALIDNEDTTDLVVSASDFFLSENTGILIDNCPNDNINFSSSAILNQNNSTKAVMEFLDEFQNLINLKNFSLAMLSRFTDSVNLIVIPNKKNSSNKAHLKFESKFAYFACFLLFTYL
ncbi:insulin-like growth factor-binding complex acid labile subunit [Brachionus plicatilis]|uniref:Insulin-like growth factor-binding complex acid labile subunit n=1 Tax=Brachionus plicatilis TaxID=10195 RepID=A0A3M7RPN7_BRAPC|nr:insulin-like growth factor-binding complex acid labile subunit [Brachionus plicatilis]